jgi:hypothetical protein
MRLHAIRATRERKANREFESSRLTGWQWFVVTLAAFTMMDYLCLGLKAMK